MKFLWAACASHVGDAKRCGFLNDMLASWEEQTVRVPMCVSISHSEEMRERVEELVERWSVRAGVVFLLQPGRLYQFEHYSKAMRYISAIQPQAHVVFTDDDDLWNKTRCETYLKYDDDIFEISGSVVLGSNIEECLSKPSNAEEYVQLCMKIDKFDEIFHGVLQVNPQGVKCWVFDLYFYRLATSLSVKYETQEWLYFYRSSYKSEQLPALLQQKLVFSS